MQLSAAHLATRDLAARLPALQASFDLLDAGAGQASIEILDAASAVLVAIPIADGVGTIDAQAYQITLTVPIEAQIAAPPADIATLARAVTADDRSLHPRIPEIAQVLAGQFHRRLALRGKVAGDLVGHIGQPGQVHARYSAGSTAMRRLFSDQLA